MWKPLLTAIATAAVASSAACAPAPRTQVMVSLDADEALRGEVRLIHVEVFGGERGGELEPRFESFETISTWPLEIAIVPFDRDATREVRVIATALATRMGPPIVSLRIDTGFVLGRTVLLERTLMSSCRGVSCEGATTCSGALCVSSRVEPGLLPDYRLDAGPGPDATYDAAIPLLPDAWSPPVRAEGEPCDLAAVSDRCARGTACTCSGARGCESGTEAARCWASRDVSCGRPIDLTERVEREDFFELTGSGAGTPDIITTTCLAPGGELVYLLRAPTVEYRVNVLATGGMEYWMDCGVDTSWGLCTDTWNIIVPRGGTAYVLVEGNGEHQLRVDRLP